MTSKRLERAVDLLKERVSRSQRGPYVKLNPPATEEALAFLLAALGKSPPPDLAEWLLIHDGESGQVGLLGLGAHLFSSAEIGSTYLSLIGHEDLDEQDEFMFVSGPARQRAASNHWIPVAQINNEMVFLDYDPMPGGRSGQVIFVDVAGSTVTVAYSSLAEVFEAVAVRT